VRRGGVAIGFPSGWFFQAFARIVSANPTHPI